MQFKRLVPILLVVVLVLGATIISVVVALRDAQSTARRLLVQDATQLSDTVADAMKSYEQVLRSSLGLLNARGTVSVDEWRVFVRSLAIDREFPGIQGLGYVEVFNSARRGSHVDEQRRAGRPSYQITPPGDRDPLTAIVYLEPDTWRNQRAIGYDMFSERTRRAAMERSRDTGLASLTSVVTLVQETHDHVQPGALLYLPIYRSVEVPVDINKRRDELRGYVYSAFRLKDFLRETFFKNEPGLLSRVRLEVFDGGETTSQHRVFDSFTDAKAENSRAARSEPATSLVHSRALEIAGHQWTIRASSRPALDALVDWSKPWSIAVFGTVLGLLIAGIVWSLTRAREKSMLAEQRLAAEIEERKRAQDQLQLLNHELIHRVKNTLAIVSAIASQTARYSASLEDFNTAFRDRLAALGRVHDHLGTHAAFEPEFRAFIEETLAPYNAGRGISLTIAGPSVQIPRNEAILLSLLLNELATNATKYGAWSTPGGVVTVNWVIHPGDQGEELEWYWRESNGPTVTPPDRTGFGTSVMKSIERGLRGRIEIAYHSDGVKCRVQFPRMAGHGPSEPEAGLQGDLGSADSERGNNDYRPSTSTAA